MYEETGPSGERLEPEPQAERGAPGSRDTGSDQPAGGPVDRPVGEADPGDSTSIDPPDTSDDAPDLQRGGG